jgi:hypothetical protein
MPGRASRAIGSELTAAMAFAKSMSPIGTKRQFARCKTMSEVGGKADLPVERPDFSV